MLRKYLLGLVFAIFISFMSINTAVCYDGNYDMMLPYSDSRLITTTDLSSLKPWELKVARNEIYARHGRAFKSGDLRCYFQTKEWYNVNPHYSDSLLNTYEKKNAVTILNYEKKTGSLFTYKDMGCDYGKAMNEPPPSIDYTNTMMTDYILPETEYQYINSNMLAGLTPWELKVARNEIYARHGRAFKSGDLRCYFQSKPWYTVNNRYSDSLLNKFEQKNVITILNYEKAIKSPATLKDMGCGYGVY
jgi:hypothetical protein